MHPEWRTDIPFVRDVVNGVEANAPMVGIRSWDGYVGVTAQYYYEITGNAKGRMQRLLLRPTMEQKIKMAYGDDP